MRSSSKSRDLRMQKIETSMLKRVCIQSLVWQTNFRVWKVTLKLLARKMRHRSLDSLCTHWLLWPILSMKSTLVDENWLGWISTSNRNNFAAPKLQYQHFCFGERRRNKTEISETHKVSQWVSYPKRGTNSNHGSNNFRRQGASYLKHPQHFFAPGPGPRPTEETSIKIQSTQSRSGRAHKVAHDQLGSQVSLPFPPSIPCMAGRLKNYVHKWHTITSDQWSLMLLEGSLLTLLQNPLNYLYPTSTNLICWRLRLMGRLHVFLKGGSLRKPHTQMESTFPTFSYLRRKMVLIGLFLTSNNWLSQWNITILKQRILGVSSLLWPQTALWPSLI